MAWSHQRREQIARDLGFDSAYERRQANKFAKESTDFVRLVGEPKVSDKGDAATIKLYYQAMKKGNPDDYSLQTRNGKPVVRNGKGAKAKWLITVAGYLDMEAWKEHYPQGTRD